ncbi:MAG TPA: hypothetical protein VIK30_04030, partial [Polyangia bacterium]
MIVEFNQPRKRMAVGWLIVAVASCGRARPPAAPIEARRSESVHVSVPAPKRPTLPDLDALPAAPDLPPERRAIQVVGGRERVVDAEAARARGLTLVDLSDGWAPSVFDDRTGPTGATLPNPYRAVYTGLASDRGDGDGQPLGAGERNYLELYGIPPAPSVL